MQIVFEKTLETSSTSNRIISRSSANLIQLPSRTETLFALFFGETIFRQRQLITAVNTAIKAFPADKRNLDAFLDFYNLVLDKRRERLLRAKIFGTNPAVIFCFPRAPSKRRKSKTNNRLDIKHTDVSAAQAECKSPPPLRQGFGYGL